jgi:hypothetical protein
MATLTITNPGALQKTRLTPTGSVWQLGRVIEKDDEYVWEITTFNPVYELRISRIVRSGLVRVVVWDLKENKEIRSGWIPLKEMMSVGDFRRAMESDWLH